MPESFSTPPKRGLQHQTDDDPAWLGGGGPRIPPADPDWELPVPPPADRRKLFMVIGVIAVVGAIALIAVLAGGDEQAAATTDAGADESIDASAADLKASKANAANAAARVAAKAKEAAAAKKKAAQAKADAAAKDNSGGNDSKKPDKPKEPPPSKAGEVTITVLVVPPSARVVIGGKRAKGSIKFKRSDKSLPVKVTAPGYKTKTLNVIPSRDRELILQLLPEEKPPEEKPPDPKPPEEKPPDPKPPEEKPPDPKPADEKPADPE